MTQAVESEASLADGVAATRARRDELAAGGTTASAAAFVSRAFGLPDMARLALTHDADLMVVDGREEIASDGSVSESLALVLERSPCHVAVLAGSPPLPFADGVAVLFAGGDHDWAAAELGAWLAAGASAPLRLIGVRGRDGGDASRLLASASIAIQQVVRAWTSSRCSPMPGPRRPACRSRLPGRDGRGTLAPLRRGPRPGCRDALLAAGSPTLVVHRGARPGGLAPREQLTRFTWTIAGAG